MAAFAQGWGLYWGQTGAQIQKIDDPDSVAYIDMPSYGSTPKWDSDAIAYGIVYHGSDPVHVAAREFLKTYAPHEWAFITEHINAATDPEGTLHPSAGAADGG